jgi:uncharacterized protein (TIGR02453 family)
MLQASTLKFLKNLKKNNNKPWFDRHRPDYDAAKLDFGNFIQAVIDRHGRKDTGIASLKAKDCLFRINRDIRFSKDKTPYKSNMGASVVLGGKKSIFAGYYFHCEPGKSFIGGGLWIPQPQELRKVRQEIDYCWKEFKTILSTRKFKSVYGDLDKEGELSLSKVPQDFERESPAAEYLKLKSFIAMTALKDSDLTSKDLLKKTLDAFEALQPVVKFINRSLKT